MNAAKSIESNNRLAEAWDKTEKTLAAHAAYSHVPLGGTFELTARCNFNCKMCYVRLSKSQMERIGRERTAEEWIALAREAIKAGTLNLLITGGEPLLRDDFEEIYSALAEMGFIITLNTNAALMNKRFYDLFKKYPPTATNVTLYGASPNTYEKVCSSAGGFEKTIEGLEMLSSISTVLEVRSTFIRDNMNELDKVRSIADRYTNRFAINTFVYKPVRGAETGAESCRLTPSETQDLIDANYDYYQKLNDGSVSDTDKETPECVADDTRDFGFSLPPKALGCLGAKSMYWITWDGKMLPCGMFSSPYTLPFEEGFVKAWNRLPGLFMDVSLPKKCTECEYSDGRCPNCPAFLQSETGSFDSVSDYICEIARERALRKKTRQC